MVLSKHASRMDEEGGRRILSPARRPGDQVTRVGGKKEGPRDHVGGTGMESS